MSVDPLTSDYPWYTPYQFAGNQPIVAIDRDGAEPLWNISDVHRAEEEAYSYLVKKGYVSRENADQMIKANRTGEAFGAAFGLALGLDFFLFRGTATRTLLKVYGASELADAF